jgi:hypothetical protein
LTDPDTYLPGPAFEKAPRFLREKSPGTFPSSSASLYLSPKLDIGERRKEMAGAAPAGTGTMHIEAVREDASPSRTGLAEGYMKIEYAMKIECAQCWRPMTSTTTGWK